MQFPVHSSRTLNHPLKEVTEVSTCVKSVVMNNHIYKWYERGTICVKGHWHGQLIETGFCPLHALHVKRFGAMYPITLGYHTETAFVKNRTWLTFHYMSQNDTCYKRQASSCYSLEPEVFALTRHIHRLELLSTNNNLWSKHANMVSGDQGCGRHHIFEMLTLTDNCLSCWPCTDGTCNCTSDCVYMLFSVTDSVLSFPANRSKKSNFLFHHWPFFLKVLPEILHLPRPSLFRFSLASSLICSKDPEFFLKKTRHRINVWVLLLYQYSNVLIIQMSLKVNSVNLDLPYSKMHLPFWDILLRKTRVTFDQTCTGSHWSEGEEWRMRFWRQNLVTSWTMNTQVA